MKYITDAARIKNIPFILTVDYQYDKYALQTEICNENRPYTHAHEITRLTLYFCCEDYKE